MSNNLLRQLNNEGRAMRAERAAKHQAEMNAIEEDSRRRWNDIQAQDELLNNELARMGELNIQFIAEKEAADAEIKALRERVAVLEESCGKLKNWRKYAGLAAAAGLGAASTALLTRRGGRKNKRRNKRTRRH